MPHRADHPAPPPNMMMRVPYPSGMHPSYPPPPMHPAQVAAVAAHRARFFATPSYSHSPPVLRHAVTSEGPMEQPTKKRSAPAEANPTTTREESPEEAAVSALLLAANGASKPPAPSSQEGEEDDVQKPAQKRKKHLDFLRRNHEAPAASAAAQPQAETTSASTPRQPCHVSPVSSSSVGTQSTPEEYSTPGSSYDLKEGHPLNPEHRMKENMDIEDVVVGRHFPTMLHQLLEKSKVMQWLPHGQAWKVLRWDALRREVLPKHFPELEGGSIDSFLSHVRGWGFEEITDGPDVGAYRHSLFLRGIPKLCRQMRYKPPPSTQEESPKDTSSPNTKAYESPPQTNTNSNMNQPHSILQVPSLRSDVSSEKPPQKRWTERMEEEKEEQQRAQQHLASTAKAYPDSPWGGGWRQPLDPRAHYRHGPPYGPESPMMLPQGHPRPWFPFGGSHEHGPTPHHALPRVRSTRGRAVAKTGTPVATSTSSEPQKNKPSFPVSQRGKGPRGARRGSVGSASSGTSVASREKTTTFGPHLQSQGVAVAISKKGSKVEPKKEEEEKASAV